MSAKYLFVDIFFLNYSRNTPYLFNPISKMLCTFFRKCLCAHFDSYLTNSDLQILRLDNCILRKRIETFNIFACFKNETTSEGSCVNNRGQTQ